MQEEDRAKVVRQIAGSFGASSVSGMAKAAPGVAVGAGVAEAFGATAQTIITLGTVLYILMMLFYSLPKVFDAIDYLRKRWSHDRFDGLKVVLSKDHDITNKILRVKLRELERENAALKAQINAKE